jgi:hypothetical protein
VQDSGDGIMPLISPASRVNRHRGRRPAITSRLRCHGQIVERKPPTGTVRSLPRLRPLGAHRATHLVRVDGVTAGLEQPCVSTKGNLIT